MRFKIVRQPPSQNLITKKCFQLKFFTNSQFVRSEEFGDSGTREHGVDEALKVDRRIV